MILWCDDDPRALRAYEMIAPDLGVGQIDFVASAKAACLVLADRRHRVLVTDLRMPGMDGLELCRWARDWSPSTRRIVCTAWPDDVLRATQVCGLIDALVAKPFDRDTIRETLMQQITHHRRSDPSFAVATVTDAELAQARRAAAGAVQVLRMSAAPDRRSEP